MSAHDALDHGHSGLLSDAALSTLQLNHQPFTPELLEVTVVNEDGKEQAAGPFSDTDTEEQLADIKQALITGDDLLLILGENGAGKTTVLKQLEENSGLRIQCFPVVGSERYSTLNLFSGILEAFKIPPPDTLKGVLDELIPCLQSMVGRNTLSVIVLDDAHLAQHSELTQLLSGMLYMNGQDETLLRVALSATGEFEDLIPDLLPEGADLPYSSLTIEGFSPQRAAAYLDYRLQLAGFDEEFPFTDRDMASLVDHSAGRPAELNRLTADVLNEKHPHFEPFSTELETAAAGGFLQSRAGKLVLGVLATALILGGVLMFMPQPDEVIAPSPREPLVVAPQVQPQPAPTPVAPDPEPVRVIPEPPAPPTTTQLSEELNNATIDPANSADNISDQTSAALENSNLDSTSETSTNTIQTPVIDMVAPQPTAPAITEPVIPDTPITKPVITEPVSPASNEPLTEPLSDTQTAAIDAAITPAELSNTNTDVRGAPDLAGVLESPNWILVQDENLYTIQMSASTDLPSVQNFLRTNPLPPPNSIFSFERDGDIWYALVHGLFPTVRDAQSAVEQMSDSSQRDQPWIRKIERIKGIFRQ